MLVKKWHYTKKIYVYIKISIGYYIVWFKKHSLQWTHCDVDLMIKPHPAIKQIFKLQVISSSSHFLSHPTRPRDCISRQPRWLTPANNARGSTRYTIPANIVKYSSSARHQAGTSIRDQLVHRLRFYLGFAMNPTAPRHSFPGTPGAEAINEERSSHQPIPTFIPFCSDSDSSRRVWRFRLQRTLLAAADNALSNIEEVNNFKSRAIANREPRIRNL